ncbi:MAG: hypothetical protein WC364_13235 [Eubacteriales bacterium]|jgi:hypothetical protein
MNSVEFLHRLNKVKQTKENHWEGCCPAHDDQTASLCVSTGSDGKILIKCQAGCTTEDVVSRMGLKMSDLFPEKQIPAPPIIPKIVDVYDYTDANGKLIFQVCRYKPKDFKQRRPDPDHPNQCIWNMNGTQRVLYRLPKILEAVKTGQIIWIVEGEKAVHAAEAIGLVATNAPGGSCKWKEEYNEIFRGATCNIIPDNDKAGRDHAALVSKSLQGIAKSVRIIELPGLPQKGDIYDFVEARQDKDTEDIKQEIFNIMAPSEHPVPQVLKPIPEKSNIIVLPGGSTSITASAEQIFNKIAPTHRLFTRGGIVMELRRDDKKGLRLEVMKAQSFRSRIEKMGTLFAWRAGRGGEAVLKSTTCPADTAEALLSCQSAEEILPTVRGIASCPVMVEIDGQPQVLGKGYHSANGGLLITAGEKPPEISLEDAYDNLRLLVEEFDFSTPSDRSRALASFITPALRVGGWLRGHIAIDMAEANDSQSGKGYRQNLIFAVYNERPSLVTLKNGGVGGLDESISQALIYGRPFIQIDNVRGKLDSQFIEMMMTAGGMISARIPQKAEVLVDSRHFVLMMTSNGVETTPDLANRSSIIRIRKRYGYNFKTFPEGDLLDHVIANQPLFLGSIFSVIKAWHSAGKKRTTDTTHDFREWAQTLGWITENILHEAPLMEGHRHAQERVSNPALTWLRKVAIAVETDKRLEEEIMASDLAELCEAHTIEIPGLRDLSDEIARNKRVGILMRKAFGDTTEIQIDRCKIQKTEKEHFYQENQQWKTLKCYIFSAGVTKMPVLPGFNEKTL